MFRLVKPYLDLIWPNEHDKNSDNEFYGEIKKELKYFSEQYSKLIDNEVVDYNTRARRFAHIYKYGPRNVAAIQHALSKIKDEVIGMDNINVLSVGGGAGLDIIAINSLSGTSVTKHICLDKNSWNDEYDILCDEQEIANRSFIKCNICEFDQDISDINLVVFLYSLGELTDYDGACAKITDICGRIDGKKYILVIDCNFTKTLSYVEHINKIANKIYEDTINTQRLLDEKTDLGVYYTILDNIAIHSDTKIVI
jgi:hypothetical protein